MAAIIIRRNVFIKPLFSLQRLCHKCVEAGDTKPQPLTEDDYLVFKPGEVDVSKWKKMDARSLGLIRGMLPPSPYTVLQLLRSKGYEAYLVGGCVRDLLLNRPPKDFDVITTADLNQIREQFHKCEVVGYRFPVCRVFIKGSVVEVSSFDTLGKGAEGKEKFLVSQMPKGRDKLDLIRWKNSMHRDFTINSLFYDPFLHKIYDYNDGMKDLFDLKLRTLVPAQLSFTEDTARILRGLRISARLGLSLTKEIKSAILKQTSSVASLGQFRTTMELDYMLSFGAAESSLSLLHKYHLLEILLPFQASYISRQANRSGKSFMMLMELLSHLDKLVTCDRPSESRLWIALLGFHLALASNPQHPFVILTFASVLYHQNWQDGLMFAREYSGPLVNFEPETLETCETISDDEVAEKVSQLALLAVDAIDVLVETDSLHKTMAKFPDFLCSGLVFIPHKLGRHSKQLFHVLAHKVEAYKKGRCSFEINYHLLKKGDPLETRFALGKIILNTMGCSVDCYSGRNEENNHATSNPKTEPVLNIMEDRRQLPETPKLNLQLGSAPVKKKLIGKLSSIFRRFDGENGYQDEQDYHQETVSRKHMEVVGISSDPKNEDCKTNQLQTGKSESTTQELINLLETVTDYDKYQSQIEGQNFEEKLEDGEGVKLNQSIAECQIMWSIQNNCRTAIEEARDSIATSSPKTEPVLNIMEDRRQLPESPNLNLQLGSSPVKEKLIGKLSSIFRRCDERNEYQDEQDNHQERVSRTHTEVVGISSDPKNEDCNTNQLETGMSESTTQELISMLETVRDNDKYPSQSEGQNLEEKLEDGEGVELNESIAECQIVLSVQNNCRKAIEVARDSIAELSKLNLFLIGFVEEQMQRKTEKHSEACGLESFPIVSEPKTTKLEKITVATISKSAIKSIMNGTIKKQRVCSYCKEVGHNKIGCPKRKMEEASCRIGT